MCVAGLNVCTQPCNHRWYSLVRSCAPHQNLANCPERLRLEGWEMRNDSCPWCDDHEVHETTHRLFGSISSASSTATASPTSPDFGPTRSCRSGSAGTISLLSRRGSSASESEMGQRHREMNDRLHLYLTTDPHEVLPSAAKNYPTYGQPAVVSQDELTSASDPASRRSSTGGRFKYWRTRGARLSREIFRT